MFLFLCTSVVVVFLFGVVFGFIIACLPKFPCKSNPEKSFRVNLDSNSDGYCKTVVTKVDKYLVGIKHRLYLIKKNEGVFFSESKAFLELS